MIQGEYFKKIFDLCIYWIKVYLNAKQSKSYLYLHNDDNGKS